MSKRETTNEPSDLAQRVAALEQRLADVERVPTVAHGLRQERALRETAAREQRDAQRAAEERAAAEPARRALFDAFVAERLVRGAGRRTIDCHVHKAYVDFLAEREASAFERYAEAELLEHVAALEGVQPIEALNYMAAKMPAFEGVAVADAWRDPRDASDDDGLVRLEARRAASRALAG